MANCITILRILLILPILTLISPDQSFNNWAALVIFVIASVSDHLDGYVARKTQTASNLGALLDLLADKLLICIVLSYVISITGELWNAAHTKAFPEQGTAAAPSHSVRLLAVDRSPFPCP